MADDLENDQLMDENARLMADLQRASEGEDPGPGRRVPGPSDPTILMQEMEAEMRLMRLEIDELNRHKTVATETVQPSGTINVTGQIIVKLTSAATGGGWYNGTYWTSPGTTPTGTVTLTEAQVGIVGAAVKVCNLAEVTKNTHIILFSGSPSPFQFIFPGTLIQPTGAGQNPFVAIYAAQFGCT